MEFSVSEWIQCFLSTLEEDDTKDSQDSMISSIEKTTSITVNDKSTQTLENDVHPNQNTDRNYCLIIFNNPKWSEILQRRQRRRREQTQQPQAQIHVCHESLLSMLYREIRNSTLSSSRVINNKSMHATKLTSIHPSMFNMNNLTDH